MALYADSFVFIRVPRSGSAWVHDVLLTQAAARDFGLAQHVSYPLLVDLKPELVQGKPSFGTIRNPWEWYASVFRYLQGRNKVEGGFRDFLMAATHATHMTDAEAEGEGLSVHWRMTHLKDTPNADKGLYTRIVNFMLGYGTDTPVDLVVATDHLAAGLSHLMNGEPIQQQFSAPRNTTVPPGSGTSRASYDAEMVEWVRTADAELIRRFGFEPFTPSPFAVYETATVFSEEGIPAPEDGAPLNTADEAEVPPESDSAEE